MECQNSFTLADTKRMRRTKEYSGRGWAGPELGWAWRGVAGLGVLSAVYCMNFDHFE